eukprot:COSAG04_NODE_7797_length_1065_cov_1.695652_4_plen_46_part_01
MNRVAPRQAAPSAYLWQGAEGELEELAHARHAGRGVGAPWALRIPE